MFKKMDIFDRHDGVSHVNRDVGELYGMLVAKSSGKKVTDLLGSVLEHFKFSTRININDLIALKFVEGGSTITQQLMKNLFFSRRKELSRKFKEALYAFVAESRHSKETILEAYLNEVYFGQWNTHEIHGVSEAARYYFNRPVYELTLAQCALLAAIVKAPNLYHPHLSPERAIARRNLVLNKMLEAQFIVRSEHARAMRSPLGVVPSEKILHDAGYFMDLVMERLPNSLKKRLDTDALTIYLTLNPYLQQTASTLLSNHVERLEQAYASLKEKAEANIQLQAALIAIDVKRCNVLALQGGRSFKETQFNRVLQGKRQPGSLFKPFVYLSAFLSDIDPPITPFTEIVDEPFEWAYEGGQLWTPRNYNEEFQGTVTVREALERSINIPTAKIAQMVGVKPIAEVLKRAGIKSEFMAVPSLALGSAEVSPFELSEAYTTIARLGNRCQLRPYLKVFDENKNIVFENEVESKEVIAPEMALQTVEILKGVFTDGTAKWAMKTGLDLQYFAGKTGTTNDYKDAWFVGFSPELLVLVWVGYDVEENVGLPGSVGALPLWIEFLKKSESFLSDEDFELSS